MSKTSHAKHEHKVHHDPVVDELVPMEDDTFAKRHKTLIWVIIIGLVVMLPIVFGALALLHAI